MEPEPAMMKESGAVWEGGRAARRTGCGSAEAGGDGEHGARRAGHGGGGVCVAAKNPAMLCDVFSFELQLGLEEKKYDF